MHIILEQLKKSRSYLANAGLAPTNTTAAYARLRGERRAAASEEEGRESEPHTWTTAWTSLVKNELSTLIQMVRLATRSKLVPEKPGCAS